DSWDDQLRSELWQEAFEHFGIDTERYLGTLPLSARLPWDHFDIGLEDGFLAREYRKALHSRLSPPCGKAAGMFIHHTNVHDSEADPRKLVCYDCGIACDMTRMREQRIGFLKGMGSLEPAENKSLPLFERSDAPADASDPQRLSPERFRPPRPGGAPERFRLRYAKLGPATLLGHL